MSTVVGRGEVLGTEPGGRGAADTEYPEVFEAVWSFMLCDIGVGIAGYEQRQAGVIGAKLLMCTAGTVTLGLAPGLNKMQPLQEPLQ